MRVCLIAACLLTALASVPSSHAQPASAPLAAHRIVYDLTLARGGGGSTKGIDNARGRIVFDFLGDGCEGYALNYRQVTVLESSEVGARTSDLRTATFESGDETSFRFKSESDQQGGASRKLDGTAERTASGGLTVQLRQPKRETIAVADEVLFPSAHMKRLIVAARRGETTVAVKVYDGSDDGRKVYDTLAVIGRPVDPATNQTVEAPLRADAMMRMTRWPVTLSYYAPGEGERTPIYVISFELYENGVSRALRLDYGGFALRGEVSRFDLMPASACQR
jgi:hypothetical protein